MASFNMFHIFPRNLGQGSHDFDNTTYRIALTNVQPDVAVNQLLSSITQIASGTGYTTGGTATTYVSSNQTSGVCAVIFADVTFTASGGSMGPFRYAVLCRDTTALVGYWDYGSSKTLASGETFTVDLSATNGILKMS